MMELTNNDLSGVSQTFDGLDGQCANPTDSSPETGLAHDHG